MPRRVACDGRHPKTFTFADTADRRMAYSKRTFELLPIPWTDS
jgi:hypothetical protein